jgi:hypothetical protein
MTGRGTLYLLLTVVAGAAAMLSFAALRDLALLCGFGLRLAWLLPVVVDAGAAAGSLVWLGERAGESARRFARRLALGLLGLSVAANALGHGLAAFVLLPPWWVVVLLSGIAPAVLGAMVHLAVLVGRPQGPSERSSAPEPDDVAQTGRTDPPVAPGAGDSPWTWNSPPTDAPWPLSSWAPQDGTADDEQSCAPPDDTDRAAVLIAAGAGRRRLSRELGVTEYEARRLIERARPATDIPAAGTTTDDTPTDDPAAPMDDTAAAETRPTTAGARS